MKTKNIILALAILPIASFAQSSQDVARALEAKLKASEKTLDNGIQIKSVSKDEVTKAMAKLGGNITLEVNKDTMKFKGAELSGGVLVGNGGDGLVATSSADQAGPVVVRPPIMPSTSLTVVGRSGDENDTFCVAKYVTDKGGTNVVQGQSFTKPLNNCAALNSPLRLDAGLYQVFLVMKPNSNSSSAARRAYDIKSDSMTVLVNQGENKVIFLREIHVPRYNGKVAAYVYPDLSKSTMLKKYLLQLEPMVRSDEYKNLAKECKASLSKVSCEWVTLNDQGDYKIYGLMSMGPIQLSWRSFGDGGFIGVFPGTYAIEWIIDGQKESPTLGIEVE